MSTVRFTTAQRDSPAGRSGPETGFQALSRFSSLVWGPGGGALPPPRFIRDYRRGLVDQASFFGAP